MRLRNINRKFIKFRKPLIYLLPVISLVFFIVFFYSYLLPFINTLGNNGINFNLLKTLILKDNKSIIKTNDNKVNIILLGISGDNSDGADLTDTIIYLNFDLENKKAYLTSIPRDLWIPSLKAKINTAYYYGEKKKENGGLIMAKSTVEEVVGQPIPYSILMDFTAFEKIIDLFGGVDVFIEEGFIDDKYPIVGKENEICNESASLACRYEIVVFEKGWKFMDGKTALKYVRSRKANNDQGTDFARSIRQQQVIKALKNKFNKISLVQKVKKLIPLYMIGKEYIKTDLNLTELLILGKYLYGLNENNIKTVNLTDVKNEMQDGGLLIHPNTEEYDGQWVLIPISKDFSQIHEYIKCSIYSNCSLN